MPLYEYEARTEDDRSVKGTVEAPSKLLAIVQLRQRRLAVKTLREVVEVRLEPERPPGRFAAELWAAANPVSPGALAGFWSQFAQLIHAGISVHEALLALQGRVSGRIARALRQMAPEIAAGRSLHSQTVRFAAIFPPHVQGMLRAAQSSGDLESIATDLAAQYTQEQQAALRLLPTKLYFSVVAVLCVLVIPFALIVVQAPDLLTGLHRFTEVAVRRILPWTPVVLLGVWLLRTITNLRGVKAIRDTASYHLAVLMEPLSRFGGTLAAIVFLPLLALRVGMDLPLVTARWRFVRCLQVMMRAGVDLPRAVDVAADAIGNAAMAAPYKAAAARMRHTGANIEGLADVPLLPPEARNALLTAGQTGGYDQTLERLATDLAIRRDTLMRQSTLAVYGIALLLGAVAVVGVLAYTYPRMYELICQRFESPEWMP